jgi:DNA-binding MarR family transcriptional regulator
VVATDDPLEAANLPVSCRHQLAQCLLISGLPAYREGSAVRADLELPLSRFEPMQVIARLEPCRVQDIARELSITVGGVSKLVDRIESAGLCQRRVNPDDARSSIITLTSRGRRVLSRATAVFQKELETQVGLALSDSDLEQLARTLSRLREHRADLNSATLESGRTT